MQSERFSSFYFSSLREFSTVLSLCTRLEKASTQC